MVHKVESFEDIDLMSNGVPGFSKRLNYLFDLAGAPKDVRLTWGSERWNCVPNTIGNWLKRDIVPKKFTVLQVVVNDLLNSIPGRYDINLVIAWLYTGTNNPFETKGDNHFDQIDHLLQIKIFNKIYEMCMFQNIDFEGVDCVARNRVISMVYYYVYFNDSASSYDEKIKYAEPYISFWIKNSFKMKIK